MILEGRPISLLSTFSKVLKKSFVRQHYKFGFRQQGGTSTAKLYFTDGIQMEKLF